MKGFKLIKHFLNHFEIPSIIQYCWNFTYELIQGLLLTSWIGKAFGYYLLLLGKRSDGETRRVIGNKWWNDSFIEACLLPNLRDSVVGRIKVLKSLSSFVNTQSIILGLVEHSDNGRVISGVALTHTQLVN